MQARPVIGQPLSAGAVHSSVMVVAVEDFRVSAHQDCCGARRCMVWPTSLKVQAGAEGVSGSGHERTATAVERSDSAVVVTTLISRHRGLVPFETRAPEHPVSHARSATVPAPHRLCQP